MKPVQYFSDDYLEQCRHMTVDQIIRYLDDFRGLAVNKPKIKSRLISIKVPGDLLESFKTKSELVGQPYQTQIKALMRSWVLSKEGGGAKK